MGSSQVAGDAGDISNLFNDSEAEAGPEVEARVTVVESSEYEPDEKPQPQLALPSLKATPTKKKTKAQTSHALKPSSAYPVEVGRKKQKSSGPPVTKKPDLISKEG
ncbi:hypothetical protein ACFX2F_023079 [Malus domestica]